MRRLVLSGHRSKKKKKKWEEKGGRKGSVKKMKTGHLDKTRIRRESGKPEKTKQKMHSSNNVYPEIRKEMNKKIQRGVNR